MADFLKSPGMPIDGYDTSLNRQIVDAGKSSLIALSGGGPRGEKLVVGLNNPRIGEVHEKARVGDQRTFQLVGRAPGNTMVEAKSDDGRVRAFMQLEVRSAKSVASMAMEEKLRAVISRSEAHMPAELWTQVKLLLSDESIALMAGVTVAWAASHFFGVGEFADVILVVLGGTVLGLSVIDVGREMYAFARGTRDATTEQELEVASQHFAKAVVLAGVTTIAAMFFKSRPKTTFKEPFFGGAAKIPPAPPRGPGLIYQPTELLAPIRSPPGSIIRGTTSAFGDITIEIRQPLAQITETLLHERVHQFLTPKLYFLRNVRVKAAMEGYNRSYILRYLEEAMAQTYALVKTRGAGAALEGLRFPVKNGYVTVVAMASEARGVLLGTVTVGAHSYRVYADLKGQ